MSGSKIRLYGSTSGYVELEAPAVGDDGVLVLPTAADGFGAAGIGSNVVQTVKTDTFSTASTSLVDVTGMSVTITPTSATSKILVVANYTLSASANVVMVTIQLLRGATKIYESTTGPSTSSGFFGTSETSDRNVNNQTPVFLDSPASASAVTYKLQMKVNTNTGYVGRWGEDANQTAPSSITVIEVAA